MLGWPHTEMNNHVSLETLNLLFLHLYRGNALCQICKVLSIWVSLQKRIKCSLNNKKRKRLFWVHSFRGSSPWRVGLAAFRPGMHQCILARGFQLLAESEKETKVSQFPWRVHHQWPKYHPWAPPPTYCHQLGTNPLPQAFGGHPSKPWRHPVIVPLCTLDTDNFE
jgi:hypothetical protein